MSGTTLAQDKTCGMSLIMLTVAQSWMFASVYLVLDQLFGNKNIFDSPRGHRRENLKVKMRWGQIAKTEDCDD